MTYDRSDRIRRAAILVASLDEPLAERLLADLPPAEAARILEEAEQLEAIDPEEQQDVLAEFRRLTRAGRPADDAVEFSYSGGEGREGLASSYAEPSSQSGPSAAGGGLTDGDATAMAELLAGEHPQIVAAALARLGEEQSAAVFAALPAELQADALERLAALAPADEDAVQEVESQLQHRLQQRREHQARSAAGAALVQRILARTPDAQRTYLLARMAKPHAAGAVSRPAAGADSRSGRAASAARGYAFDPVAQQAINLASAVRRAHASGADDAQIIEDCTAELEQLSDQELVAGLRASGEQTVLRALAASGDAFLARVMNMLPRRQAKQLRRMLRNLGPTRLADLQQAQHELLRLAHEMSESEAEAAA